MTMSRFNVSPLEAEEAMTPLVPIDISSSISLPLLGATEDETFISVKRERERDERGRKSRGPQNW